ncbi:MAG: serine hydrolase [Mycoplasmatales bacterium]
MLKVSKIVLSLAIIIVVFLIIFFRYNAYQYAKIVRQIISYQSDFAYQTDKLKKTNLIFPQDIKDLEINYKTIKLKYEVLKKISYILNLIVNVAVDEKQYQANNYEYILKIMEENITKIQETLNVLPEILQDETLTQEFQKLNDIALNKVDYTAYSNEILKIYTYIKLKYSLADIINIIAKDVHLGYVYWNPNTDEIVAENENEIFLAASTYKLGVALQIVDGVNEGKYNLTDKVSYKKEDYGSGAGIIQYQAYGTTYTIDELLQIMIHYSDNVAAHMLIRYIGKANYQKFMDEVTDNNYTFEGNEITPQAGFLLVQKLYLNENQNPLYNDLISYLENTVYEDRISLYMDNDIVAHKIGDYSVYTNDIGIVYNIKPFVMSYYCEGNSLECKQVIGEMTYIFNLHTALSNKK